MILESVKDTEDIHSLLTMIQEENTLAFNMFYEMYYDQVFRYTYYFLKDTESCREVVADVFFAVWQSRKRLKDIENLEAYLFISVRNEVTRYNKKNGRQNRVSLDELPVSLEITEEESPYDKFSYKENSTLTEKTHNKERLLREEGGALLIYSNPLFQQMKRKSHDQAYVTQVCYSD